MKLDNDLIRDMLLHIEEDADGILVYMADDYCRETFPSVDESVSVYHMKYLIDTGYIQYKNGGFRDITPVGRDFLNNIRDDGIWKKTKDKIKPLGTVAIDVISSIAAKLVKESFNLP